MNLAPVLAEAYNYAEMFNREHDGGSNSPERIMTAGLSLEKLITDSNHEMFGGSSESANSDGPFANKTIPAGLVLDCRRNKHKIEYESHLESGSSGVISDDLFDRLFDAISPTEKRRNVTEKRKRIGTKSFSKRRYKHKKEST